MHVSWEGLEASPAESWEQAGAHLAGLAKLLSPGLMRSGTDGESRAKIVQKLDELEVQLRNCGTDGNASFKAALAELQALLRAWPRLPGAEEPLDHDDFGLKQSKIVNVIDSKSLERDAGGKPVSTFPHPALGQKTAPKTGGEGTAEPSPSVAGDFASNQASPEVAEPVLGDPETDVAALAGKLQNACDDVHREFGEGVDRDGRAGVGGAEAGQEVALKTPVRDLTGGAQTMRDHGECATSLDQFDRLAREFQRSLTQLEAAKANRPLFEGRGTTNRVPETFAWPSVDQGRYDALERHIETSHQRLAARLEAGLAAGAIEMNTLKREIATLAERLDHGGEGLASLAGHKSSIGDLTVQLEETRGIASGLSNAAEPPAGVPEPSNGHGSFEGAQSIMRGIAGLQALHEETAKRAQLVLAAIQASVEQVASRCARIEAAGGGMRPDRLGAAVAPTDPFAPILTYLARRGKDGSLAERARPGNNETPLAEEALADDGVQGAGVPGAGKLQVAVHGGTADTAAFLIEPGLGLPGRREHRASGGQSAPPTVSHDRDEGARRADSIAAPRRAARTAQMELHGATPKSRAGEDGRAEPRALLLGRSRGLFVMYKRPLVVAAVLLAAIGAYALARTLTHNNLNDFAPEFLRQFGRGAGHAKPAGAASRMSQTLASTTPAELPASQAPQNAAPGGKLPASGRASTMAALLDPSPAAPAEPGFPSDSGALSPATRAIIGSDAIVAAPIRPGNVASKSAPPRRPAAAVPAKALAPAALTATPTTPSGDPTTAQGTSAQPATELSKNLVGQAEAGDAAAQFDLAVHYAESGAGPRNYALAAQWYGKAAQQGLAVAEYRLGSLYEKGLGVGKDIERAKDLYQRAAEKGNTHAMHNLGVLAAEGTGGKPNYTSAALWFGKAAEYGIRDSQYNLAVLLARGLGLPKDLVKSYTWFAIVAAAGDAGAEKKRDDVAARLTSSELAAATAAAAAFEPRPAGRAANEAAPPSAPRKAAPAQGQPVKPKVSGL